MNRSEQLTLEPANNKCTWPTSTKMAVAAVTSLLVIVAVCVVGVVGAPSQHARTAVEADAHTVVEVEVTVQDAYTGGNDAHDETHTEEDNEAHTEEDNKAHTEEDNKAHTEEESIGYTKTQTMKEKCEVLLTEQKVALEKLGCHPVTTRVSVKSLLNERNHLRDKRLYPKVIAVDRCQGNNSFCGDEWKGNIEGNCQPDAEGHVSRKVAVYFINKGDKEYRLLEVVEHTSCYCVG